MQQLQDSCSLNSGCRKLCIYAFQAEICEVDGSLQFFVRLLSYVGPSRTLSIVENGGGILRNVSSHVAASPEYRAILRQVIKLRSR